tara:strand:- start:159 stop:368 length:210 start_codon:yes stop_codon:yes gene_type:complete
MGIVNSLIAEAEFANVRAQAQTRLESTQGISQETELEPKQRPKSGPGGYGSHLTKEEIDYWVKKVPITY